MVLFAIDSRRESISGLMLFHCPWRWLSIEAALDQCLMLAGIVLKGGI